MFNNFFNYIKYFDLEYILFSYSIFDIKLPEGSEDMVKFAFGVFILSLVAFVSFFNIVGYFLSLYLVQRYNLEQKYPKFKKIVNYFEKSSLAFILFEVFLCVFCLLFLMVSSLYVFKKI